MVKDREAWRAAPRGHQELDMTEWLNNHLWAWGISMAPWNIYCVQQYHEK